MLLPDSFSDISCLSRGAAPHPVPRITTPHPSNSQLQRSGGGRSSGTSGASSCRGGTGAWNEVLVSLRILPRAEKTSRGCRCAAFLFVCLKKQNKTKKNKKKKPLTTQKVFGDVKDTCGKWHTVFPTESRILSAFRFFLFRCG